MSSTGAWDIEVGKHPMDVETSLLTKRSGAKDSDDGDLLHRTGSEVGVANVQFLDWTVCSVPLNGDYPTAEDAGRDRRGKRTRRRGGA